MTNLNYIKAGWINNMSAKDSYDHVYHLRRLMSYANRTGDRRLLAVSARLIYSWTVNEPEITFAALQSHVERGAK